MPSGSKSVLIIFTNLQSALQVGAEGFQPLKVFEINTERSAQEISHSSATDRSSTQTPAVQTTHPVLGCCLWPQADFSLFCQHVVLW